MTKQQRLSFRVPYHEKDLIQAAADKVGVSLSKFIVNSAVVHAKEVMKKYDDSIVVYERDDRIEK